METTLEHPLIRLNCTVTVLQRIKQLKILQICMVKINMTLNLCVTVIQRHDHSYMIIVRIYFEQFVRLYYLHPITLVLKTKQLI